MGGGGFSLNSYLATSLRPFAEANFQTDSELDTRRNQKRMLK